MPQKRGRNREIQIIETSIVLLHYDYIYMYVLCRMNIFSAIWSEIGLGFIYPFP